MKYRYLLFFIILLATASFADTRCDTSYTDNLTIRVLDAKSRPVDGATVYFFHQYSGSVGASGTGTYHTIGPKFTDSQGLVKYKVKNIEQTASKLNCDITINASEGGGFKKETIIANAHSAFIDLKLDIYPVYVYAKGQDGYPIKNATVTADSKSKKTDQNGYVKFYSKAGKLDYLVSYLEGKQSGSIQVTGDTTYSVVMSFYTITVDVVDDMGKPLNSSISIFNKVYQLEDGHFSKDKTFGTEVDFTVTYAGVSKKLKMYPAVDPKKQVVFDLTSPKIGNITKSDIKGKTRLSIPVTDGGLYPSGVDTSSIVVTYRLEPAASTAQWSRAVTYVSSKNVFIADFPEFKPNSLVQFKVEVADKEGNKATVNGRFSTSSATQPANVTKPQTPTEEGDEFPFLNIVIGALIMIFIIYLFFRLKGMGGEKQ